MTQLTQPKDIATERALALAELVRATAAAPDAPEVAQHAAAALRRVFPTATGTHVHELAAPAEHLLPLLDRSDSLFDSAPASRVLRRAALERRPVAVTLPILTRKRNQNGGQGAERPTGRAERPTGPPEIRLAAAPIQHGERSLGTLALTLPAVDGWSTEDESWLSLLAQQAGLGLAQARTREQQLATEQRYQEMSEAIEAHAQARVEQLAGRGRQLEALFQLSTQISMSLDEPTVTAMALDHLIALTDSRVGCVVMLDPAGALSLGCVRALQPGGPSHEAWTEALHAALHGGLRELVEPVVHGGRSIRRNEGVELGILDFGFSILDCPKDRPPIQNPKSKIENLDSLLAVPLSSGHRSLGALILIGRLPGYDEADERLVSMFGLQAAVAIQNARMMAKIEGSLQTRRRELTSLSRTAQQLATAVDEDQVLERVVAIIRETFNARAAWIMLRDTGDDETGGQDRRGQRAVDLAGSPRPPVSPSPRHRSASSLLRIRNYQGEEAPAQWTEIVVPDDEGIIGEALRTLGPVFDGKGQGAGGTESGCPLPLAPCRSLLCVPLVVHDQALGVLGIDSARFSERRPPRPQDLDLIQAFASQAAVAIENARLIGAAVRRTRREQLLNAIMDAVREPMDVGSILDRAVERLGVALEVSRCIALLPQENSEYQEHAWTEPDFPLPPDEILWESCPIVQRLEETGQPLTIWDATDSPELCKAAAGGDLPLRSLLAVPALRGGRPVALFMFHQCDRRRDWTDDDLSLAQRVVTQVAVAVENAHLYEQELQQEKFQRSMAEIAHAVGSSVELNQVLRAVGEHGMRLLDADAAYIWRLDEASRELVSTVAVGHKADKFQNLRLSLTRRSFHPVRAAAEGSTIAANGVGLDRQSTQRLIRMFDCQSLLAVPLVVRGKVFGVVQFSASGANTRFDEDQKARAEILVSQAAAAIENAQLYEAERDRAEELEVLWRIGQEIAENLQPERIYQSIVDGARQILDVDAASLMMFAEDGQTLTVTQQEGLSAEHVAAVRFRRGAAPYPRCIAVDGAHRVTTNLAQDPHYPPVAAREGLQSMLSVPMPDGMQIAGALNVYSSRRRLFRIEEAQKLGLLASFAMTTLRQARQFQREHEIAQAFQRELLPELKLDVAGFDMARKSIAALTSEADIGGDFYDVHRVSETKVGFVIGDVSGKGLAAAPETAMVKCVLRAFAFESASPAQVMERLNRLLNRTMDPERFVTLFYGLLDVEKGELTYANAGHELPLVLRRGSGEPELLETTGLLLGMDRESRYRQVCTLIGTGDTLVLYTDGFTDARKEDRFLQVEGLATLLGKVREETANDMVESVSQSVTDFSGGTLRDDATILVVKSVG